MTGNPVVNPSIAVAPRRTRCLWQGNLLLTSPQYMHETEPSKTENADTFRRELHPDLRADYVLANPPFNDSDTALRGSGCPHSDATPQVVSKAKDNFRKDDDVRWACGVPVGLNFNN